MAARSMERDRDEALNLYLDDLLPSEERVAFERRLQGDAKLRAAVEFHRGLTLEFKEETPPLPRDYEETARRRFERAVAGLPVDDAGAAAGSRPPAGERRRGRRRLAVGLTLGILLLAVGYLLWRVGAPTGRAAGDAAVSSSAGPVGTPPAPDEQTLEALRSLGYIAGGEEMTRPEPPPAPARAGSPTPVPPSRQAVGTGPGSREPAVALGGEERPSPVPPASPVTTGPIDYRWLAVQRAPALGRDHQIIREAAAWRDLVGDTDAPVDFESEMVVILRHRLGSDPPSRLVPVAVIRSATATLIECRVDRDDTPGAEPRSLGQALILPASDRPIQIVMR